MCHAKVFSRPLYYNRLTGTFLDRPRDADDAGTDGVESKERATVTTTARHNQQPPYGATDEQRERMIKWAKDERLPIFFR